jgi:uncharacterized protein
MTDAAALANAVAIDLGGHVLWLTPGHAAWHPATRTLFVADVHVGKAASFRALGQPVPAGTTQDNLRRLGALVAAHGAARIVFLGDLLHSAHAQRHEAIEPLRRWRATHAALACVLVRGNHDARAGDPPPDLGIDVVDEPWTIAEAPGLLGCHHPREIAGQAVLAGHWHPAMTLRGPGRDRQRLPCFCRVGDLLVLPSFGAFTGASPHAPPAGSTCYAVGGDRVWPGLVIAAGSPR